MPERSVRQRLLSVRQYLLLFSVVAASYGHVQPNSRYLVTPYERTSPNGLSSALGQHPHTVLPLTLPEQGANAEAFAGNENKEPPSQRPLPVDSLKENRKMPGFPLAQEELLEELLSMRDEGQTSLNDRVHNLLLLGIGKEDEQFANIEKLHKERHKIENAIVIIEKTHHMLPGPTAKRLLKRAKQRLTTCNRRQYELNQKIRDSLKHVSALSQFMKERRASFAEVTSVDRRKVGRLKQLISILQDKQAFLEKCTEKMQPRNFHN